MAAIVRDTPQFKLPQVAPVAKDWGRSSNKHEMTSGYLQHPANNQNMAPSYTTSPSNPGPPGYNAPPSYTAPRKPAYPSSMHNLHPMDEDLKVAVASFANNFNYKHHIHLSAREISDITEWMTGKISEERQGWADRLQTSLREVENERRKAMVANSFLLDCKDRLRLLIDCCFGSEGGLSAEYGDNSPHRNIFLYIETLMEVLNSLMEDKLGCLQILGVKKVNGLQSISVSNLLAEKLKSGFGNFGGTQNPKEPDIAPPQNDFDKTMMKLEEEIHRLQNQMKDNKKGVDKYQKEVTNYQSLESTINKLEGNVESLNGLVKKKQEHVNWLKQQFGKIIPQQQQWKTSSLNRPAKMQLENQESSKTLHSTPKANKLMSKSTELKFAERSRMVKPIYRNTKPIWKKTEDKTSSGIPSNYQNITDFSDQDMMDEKDVSIELKDPGKQVNGVLKDKETKPPDNTNGGEKADSAEHTSHSKETASDHSDSLRSSGYLDSTHEKSFESSSSSVQMCEEKLSQLKDKADKLGESLKDAMGEARKRDKNREELSKIAQRMIPQVKKHDIPEIGGSDLKGMQSQQGSNSEGHKLFKSGSSSKVLDFNTKVMPKLTPQQGRQPQISLVQKNMLGLVRKPVQQATMSNTSMNMLPSRSYRAPMSTRRKVSIVKCLRCKSVFKPGENHKIACCYHNKGKERIERYDENGSIKDVTFVWQCCRRQIYSSGCCFGHHI